jgi:hypothetical protein
VDCAAAQPLLPHVEHSSSIPKVEGSAQQQLIEEEHISLQSPRDSSVRAWKNTSQRVQAFSSEQMAAAKAAQQSSMIEYAMVVRSPFIS